MIKKLLSIALVCSSIIAGAQSITLTYPFTNVTQTSGLVDPTPTPTAVGVTSGSFTAVGTPSANPNAAGRFSFVGWPTGGVNGSTLYTDMTGSINTGEYYEITLTPQPGYSVSLSAITFTVGRTQTGARSFAVRTNLDGYTSNLAGVSSSTSIAVQSGNDFFIVPDAGSTTSYGGPTIMGSPSLYVSVPVTFRFYGWNSEAASGAFSLGRVVITGSVVSAACNTPTITSISSNAPICSNQTLNLQSSVTGTAPFTYAWSGAGSFNSTSVASPSVTGAASGNYTLAVTNACGTATSVVTATVNPAPAFTVNSATICTGGTVALTATGTAGSYAWSPSASLSSATGSMVIASPSATQVYTILGTTGSCSLSVTSTVTVLSAPALTVNSATICAGNSAILTAGGVSTYTWTSPASNSNTISVSPSANTSYTVNGSVTGCPGTYSAVATVSVNALPTLVITPSSAAICSGKTTTLSVSGVTTQTWMPGSLTTATISVTPGTSTTYTVTGAGTGGCVNNATVMVTVNPTPTVTVNSATTCAGSTVTLTANGATSYAWSPAGTLSSPTGSVVSANPASTTTYTVVGTTGSCTVAAYPQVTIISTPTLSVNSASICQGSFVTLTASGVSTYTWTSPVANTNTISVNPSATTIYTVSGGVAGCAGTFTATGTVSVTASPTVVVSPSSPTICAGQSTALTVTGITTQTWMPGNLTAATITVTPSAQTTYTVMGTNAGCAGSNTVIVRVNALPTVAVTSATICTGKTATLTASGTATSYSWNPTSATTSTIQVSAVNAGIFTFTVTGTSAQGCSKSISTTLTGITTPTINVTATQSVICIGNPVTLTATGANTYAWTGGITNGTAFTPTATASYTVTGTVTAGSCTNTAVSTVTVDACTGINETTNATVLNIFPNPNNGTFVVQSTTFPATLVMYDVTGKQVLNKNITEMETSLNVSELGNGIYYLSLSAEGNSANYKVIIAK